MVEGSVDVGGEVGGGEVGGGVPDEGQREVSVAGPFPATTTTFPSVK